MIERALDFLIEKLRWYREEFTYHPNVYIFVELILDYVVNVDLINKKVYLLTDEVNNLLQTSSVYQMFDNDGELFECSSNQITKEILDIQYKYLLDMITMGISNDARVNIMTKGWMKYLNEDENIKG